MLTQSISNEVVITPSRIMQIGYGFWSSKVLLTAVHYDLFTLLSDTRQTSGEIREALQLHERGIADFLDALVALKLLYREGLGNTARYSNTMEADAFLNKKRSSYIGGILEMANSRLYSSWGNMEKALETGLPQNEIRNAERSAYEVLYANEEKLAEFIHAMAGSQHGSFVSFAKQMNCSGYQTHCDVGGSGGDLAIQFALHHPEIKCTTFDLPEVARIAQRNIDRHKVADRVKVASGDFFENDLPRADMITMANVLHNWDLKKRKILLKKAYEALPKAGALVALENVIDDERRESVFGLMMSLNMLINTNGGANFSSADFAGWAKETGFSHVEIMHLAGSSTALIAYK